MIAVVLSLAATLAPGAAVTDTCQPFRPQVRMDGHALRSHWNDRGDQMFWRTGHGRVWFDGLTFINSSKVTVRVSARCQEVSS